MRMHSLSPCVCPSLPLSLYHWALAVGEIQVYGLPIQVVVSEFDQSTRQESRRGGEVTRE